MNSRLSKKLVKREANLGKNEVLISLAQGVTKPSYSLDMNVYIEEKRIRKRFYILNNLLHKAILGRSALGRAGISIHCNKNAWKFDDKKTFLVSVNPSARLGKRK